MNKTENERIRQTRVTHEAMQAVLDELEQVKRERDAAVKIIQDARTYLEDLGSPKFCLLQLMKWPAKETTEIR